MTIRRATFSVLGCLISAVLIFLLATAIAEANEGCSVFHPCAVSR